METETDDRHRVQAATDFGKVAVLMGGCSAEREISLRSGNAVMQSLLSQRVDAYAIDTAKPDTINQLENDGYSRVFIALHGRGGEDGVMQGALDMIDLPYTGSGVLGSALAMDKVRSKQVWRGIGLPTPEYYVLRQLDQLDQIAQLVGFPLIVKPAREGSSIGMTKVMDSADLQDAVRLALQYDSEVLVERWIEGAEYTAAILGEQVLPLIRLETPHAFYDYEAKYSAETTTYKCPCGLPEKTERKFQSLALEAFRSLAASGWGRVDFMVDESGMPWLIEINTIPGLTDHSLVPMAASNAGIEFDELVWRILESSVAGRLPV